jgi:hypothetical protein
VAEAAIITIDITSTGFGIDGVNAGLQYGEILMKPNFPISGARIDVFVGYLNRTGIRGYSGIKFAAGSSYASPVNFTINQSIGSLASWNDGDSNFFKYGPVESPDFGAGSYMGFKTAQGNYGWLEVTWAGATDTFQIYSGAYESVANVAILAGDTGGGTSAVPEPGQVASSLLLLALGAAGVAIQRQRAKKKQQAEAVSLS